MELSIIDAPENSIELELDDAQEVTVDQATNALDVVTAEIDMENTVPIPITNSSSEVPTTVEANLTPTILADENSTNGNTWLFAMPETNYTAQLGSFNSLSAAEGLWLKMNWLFLKHIF